MDAITVPSWICLLRLFGTYLEKKSSVQQFPGDWCYQPEVCAGIPDAEAAAQPPPAVVRLQFRCIGALQPPLTQLQHE